MPHRLSALSLTRMAEKSPPARASYLLSVSAEIAALNRANGDPHYSWQALVTGDTVEIVRSIRKDPYLD